MKRRLTTILATDVVGYSRLMGEDEAGTLVALQVHRAELFDPKISQYNGRTIKLMGDGALIEFPSVVDAVVFAVEVQCAMRDRNKSVPKDKQIVFRIGINIGDVIIEGDDIYGDGVNVAARLEGLADPGGICLRRAVRNQVRDKLDLDFEDLGEIEVKNIARPVRVFRVILDDKAAALATPVLDMPAQPARGRWPAIAAGLALSVVVVAGIVWWQPWAPKVEPASVERMALPLPDKPSIAVLPFDNMSGNVEQDYFADGMTEDLITDLSNVSGLFVISRNSTFTYKDKPVEVRQVAEALGVRYVLEGSVRRAGDEVRINAQLIDALSGYHVWADRYDGSLADIFALQDKVVGQIVTALAVSLAGVETGAGMDAETGVAEAYDAFLQGWELYRRDTREDTVAAIPFFERAIELDPDYGRAYAGLAAVYWRITNSSWYGDLGLVWLETLNLAKSFATKALKHPTSVAYSISSRILTFQGRRDEALAEINRAIALDRNDPDSHISKSWILIFTGQPEQAEESARLAMRINPHFPPDYLHALGRALFYQGRHEEAAEIFERVASRQPERKHTYMRLAAAYGHLGRLEEAKAAVAKFNEISANNSVAPLTVQEVGMWAEDTYLFEDGAYPEPMFEGLRKAGVPEGAAPAREGFDFKALVSQRFAENRQIYDVKGVPKVNAATVKAFSERGVAIIDVRNARNYGRGHIPGAVNLNLNTDLTEEALSRIVDKDEEVVFHCWGAVCRYSAIACAKAHLWGYTKVHYFAGGFPAWKAAGYPVEKQ